MKIILSFVFILLSLNSHSSSNKLKPGLWEIKMKIYQDGKEFDPMAEVKKQLDKMPEAQKKMILEQMSKNSSQNDISKVCYTKEMVESPEKIASEEDKDCDHKVKTQTAKKIISEFKCKDGNHGTTTWEMIGPTQTKVHTEAVDKKGKKTQMKYEARFLKSEC